MNTETWHADIVITDDIALTCIKKQFPKLKLTNIYNVDEGWDNKVFLVNKEIIFRFPRRKIAVELIERENQFLPKLQSYFELAIPNPIYQGQPCKSYPYPFQGYRIIPGNTVPHAHLSDHDRKSSLPLLANFLKTLHSIKANQALEMGAQPQIFDRTHIQSLLTNVIERVNKLIAKNICQINLTIFNEEIEKVQELKLPTEGQCLIHGDLYFRHLLFNNGTLSGIIDWGDMGINHHSIDLGIIYSFYPKEIHDIFFEIYGTVNIATLQYARFIGLYIALTVLLYADDINDVCLKKESIDSVNRINPQIIAK